MRTCRARGVTLVELLVAVSLLSVGILAFFGAFRFITKSLSISRARTLAANLAQEKVEALKNNTYYQLLLTTAAVVDNAYSPALVYDSTNYPPETIDIGGVKFQRYTFVTLAQIDNNVISTVSYTYPDTGMKQISVTIAWQQDGGRKTWALTNLFENPFINPMDATFSGTISSAVTGVPIPGARVRIQENPDWNAVADANGAYSFRVYHGSYTVRASSAGWYNQSSAIQNACAGCSLTVNLQMTQISSGSIAGNLWFNPNLVISQVVASTAQAQYNGFIAQYIELYNPTTAAITIGAAAPPIKLNIKSTCSGANSVNCSDATYGVKLNYVNAAAPPYSYYVIANTDTFVVAGQQIAADAIYADDADSYCSPSNKPMNWNPSHDPPIKQILFSSHNATVWLTDSSGATLDTLGWEHNSTNPPAWEGAVITLSTTGLREGGQIVRVSSPAASDAVINAYGRAYDSDNNKNDFLHPNIAAHTGIVFPPYGTAGGAKTLLTGKPAVAGYVDANDSLSGSTRAYAAYIASGSLQLLYAPFRLDGVSTGTWIVETATSTFWKELSGATVTARTITSIPYSTTTPPWITANHYGLDLDSSSLNGFVSGIVANVSGSPLSGITVRVGNTTKTTGVNGAYFCSTSSGPVEILANPANADPAYVEAIAMPTIQTGQITTQDFTLSRGGTIRGYTTTGTTPLPNVVVTANIGNNQYGGATSDATGMFTLRDMSTGTFTVQPALEVGQSCSPNSYTAVITGGDTVTVGTFTISGALGVISGTVKYSVDGSNITTGALIVASPSDPGTTPPAICGSSSAALTPFYAVSSKADGTYSLSVRGGTSYYMRVYYPLINSADNTVSVQSKVFSGAAVGAGGTAAKDLTVP